MRRKMSGAVTLFLLAALIVSFPLKAEAKTWKACKKTEYEKQNGKWVKTDATTYRYNKKGRLKSESATYYNAKGKPEKTKYSARYTYKKGRLYRKKEYIGSKLVSTETRKYNKKGKLSSVYTVDRYKKNGRVYKRDKETYHYKAGRLHKVKYYTKEDNWEDWEWIDSDTYVYKNGKLSEIYGEPYKKYFYNGNRLFKIYHGSCDDSGITSEEYFNNKGKVEKIIEYEEGTDNIFSEEHYTYQYYKNQISRIIDSINGEDRYKTVYSKWKRY